MSTAARPPEPAPELQTRVYDELHAPADDAFDATVAIAGDEICLRGWRFLYGAKAH